MQHAAFYNLRGCIYLYNVCNNDKFDKKNIISTIKMLSFCYYFCILKSITLMAISRNNIFAVLKNFKSYFLCISNCVWNVKKKKKFRNKICKKPTNFYKKNFQKNNKKKTEENQTISEYFISKTEKKIAIKTTSKSFNWIE